MMHILVIGAGGRVGRKLANGLLKNGHQVTGTSRKEKKLFEASHYQQIKLNLTAPLAVIEEKIPDTVEAVYFVSGSTGKNVLQVDLHGAVKTMQAAEHKGINRYIMLSALFSLQPDKWTSLIDYYTGKYFADRYLMEQTSLDYTILQPGYLAETQGSGKIEVGITEVDKTRKNAIPNVADTLREVLDKPNTFKKVISMLDGETPIDKAIASL